MKRRLVRMRENDEKANIPPSALRLLLEIEELQSQINTIIRLAHSLGDTVAKIALGKLPNVFYNSNTGEFEKRIEKM